MALPTLSFLHRNQKFFILHIMIFGAETLVFLKLLMIRYMVLTIADGIMTPVGVNGGWRQVSPITKPQQKAV